ncbi:hypothetical protein L1987_58242 [Smallanthus sonchifolius]|uniref:Uncharacterized protein n=1 Tax=Smallanthus sonchifolius TaxID=185202 RepID=A0ACB9DES5_9ASTR|nr:hypothetical protein L1987_58242 [Smallanthus sonchifolius]
MGASSSVPPGFGGMRFFNPEKEEEGCKLSSQKVRSSMSLSPSTSRKSVRGKARSQSSVVDLAFIRALMGNSQFVFVSASAKGKSIHIRQLLFRSRSYKFRFDKSCSDHDPTSSQHSTVYSAPRFSAISTYYSTRIILIQDHTIQEPLITLHFAYRHQQVKVPVKLIKS